MLVVVNDTDQPVTLRGSWRLSDAKGRIAAQGSVTASCPPGEQETRRALIEFTAPAVFRRGADATGRRRARPLHPPDGGRSV